MTSGWDISTGSDIGNVSWLLTSYKCGRETAYKLHDYLAAELGGPLTSQILFFICSTHDLTRAAPTTNNALIAASTRRQFPCVFVSSSDEC